MYALPAPVHLAAAVSSEHASPVVPLHYTVRAGDTLSGISQAMYRNPADWTCIYAANKKKVRDPSLIFKGESLTLPRHGSSKCAVPRPPAPLAPQVTAVAVTPPVGRHTYSAVPATPVTPVSHAPTDVVEQSAKYSGSSSMQSCIIGRESGGNSQVMNGSGHYGLYQFSEGTWVANGGSPSTFGHASVAEQNQVFDNTVAASGYSAWQPYDGC